MQKLYFLIGASGAGKTTAAKEVEKLGLANLKIFYFDSIGVPSFEEMERQYGSGEEWQRVKTREWVERMKKVPPGCDVVLDAQARPSFVEEACRAEDIESYEIILFDCSDEVRRDRLVRRGQSELADERMMNWAKHLREACSDSKCKVLDNTNLTIEQTATALRQFLRSEF